jgi:hypothetical protein
MRGLGIAALDVASADACECVGFFGQRTDVTGNRERLCITCDPALRAEGGSFQRAQVIEGESLARAVSDLPVEGQALVRYVPAD